MSSGWSVPVVGRGGGGGMGDPGVAVCGGVPLGAGTTAPGLGVAPGAGAMLDEGGRGVTPS